MTQQSRGPVRRLVRGGLGIAIAMGVMNVATYAFTILAARLLGPSEYGALASLMGLVLVVNVASLGLQATGARRVAARPDRRVETEGGIMSASFQFAVVLGLVCLALTPVVAWGLNLDDWWAALMLAFTAVPLTLVGGYAGILQGEERWAPLSAIFVSMGVGRLGAGLVAIYLSPTALAAMAGVAVGAWLPALVGALALGHVGPRERRAAIRRRGGRILRELAGNSHALLAFFALSNLDVVLARALLDHREAGLYAGGLILTKAVLFLPQFVVIVAFPRMAAASRPHQMYLRGLALIAAIGVIATIGAALLGDLAVVFIGGSEYADMQDHLWLFASLGTLLAMIHMMVYEMVARQRRASVYVLWAGLPVVLGVAALVDGGVGLVQGVVVIYASVLVSLVAMAMRRGGTSGSAASASAY